MGALSSQISSASNIDAMIRVTWMHGGIHQNRSLIPWLTAPTRNCHDIQPSHGLAAQEAEAAVKQLQAELGLAAAGSPHDGGRDVASHDMLAYVSKSQPGISGEINL